MNLLFQTYYATEQDYMLAHDVASSQMNWREDRDKWFSFFEKVRIRKIMFLYIKEMKYYVLVSNESDFY